MAERKKKGAKIVEAYEAAEAVPIGCVMNDGAESIGVAHRIGRVQGLDDLGALFLALSHHSPPSGHRWNPVPSAVGWSRGVAGAIGQDRHANKESYGQFEGRAAQVCGGRDCPPFALCARSSGSFRHSGQLLFHSEPGGEIFPGT